jgi:outer membrane lipoprotein SlyB
MHGHVLVSSASGRMKGRARLVLSLDSFERNGHHYRIDTTAASRVSTSHRKRNAIGIGGGSAIGAAIGAIAGGGKGALIGAGAGAAAGTVGAAVTGKKEVTIPAESLMRFTLGAPVRV